MKDYKVLNVKGVTMNLTNENVILAELAEVYYINIPLSIGGRTFSVGYSGQKFAFLDDSPIGRQIISKVGSDSFISLNQDEFKMRMENIDGRERPVFYHSGITLPPDPNDLTDRDIRAIMVCNNCQTDQYIDISTKTPKGMFLGKPQFSKVLHNTTINCSYCGQTGLASSSKFHLSETNGLDDDYKPNISNSDKRDWFHNLDQIYKLYLKALFKINEVENVGYAINFYQCRLHLEKSSVSSNSKIQLIYYHLKAVYLSNGESKEVAEHVVFVMELPISENPPEELILDPSKYNIEEKRYNFTDGKSATFPKIELQSIEGK